MEYYKYPRTFHFAWSENLQNDDRLLESDSHLSGQEVIVTEKLDGENCNLYQDYMHARSLSGRHHPSRNWIKKLHAEKAHLIPKGWRICGENVFAFHSIFYNKLSTYFYVFAIFNEHNESIDWDEVVEWSQLLGLETVPVLYRGPYDIDKIKKCYVGKSKFEGWTAKDNIDYNRFRELLISNCDKREYAEETQEGYVCRVSGKIKYEEYPYKLAKFVRKSHVQTPDFWMNLPVISNNLV
jgi:hypothetical protein